MKVEKIDENNVSVIATEKQWAQLSKIINWVVLEGGDMDEATLMLQPGDLALVLAEWRKITSDALSI